MEIAEQFFYRLDAIPVAKPVVSKTFIVVFVIVMVIFLSS